MLPKGIYTLDYSHRDYEIVNYGFYELPYLPGYILRGPAIDVEGRDDYFSCIGAAQTLGVYVNTSFPQLLSQRFGVPAWNLGVGAADPGYFLKHPDIIEYVNKGRFAVLQIMSARSEPNDRIRPTDKDFLSIDNKQGDTVFSHIIWQRIKEEEPENLQKYIEQSRASWERHMEELISKITVPIICFWFSPKKLDHSIDVESTDVWCDMMDVFPQYLTGENMGVISKAGESLVTCFSDRNQAFALRSLQTGKVVEVKYAVIGKSKEHRETKNVYYPSPEMHWDAASVLAEVIEERGLLE